MNAVDPLILKTREVAQLYSGPSMDSLLTAMAGHASTNKWDIACSYTVKQLNTFLASQYDAGKLAKEIHPSTVREDPFSGQTFTIQYDIFFASPTLSFVAGRSGMATLTMEMLDGSSYTIKETSKTTKIPGGKYSVQCVVPLAAMSGDTGTITDAGDVIQFSDGKKDENHVIVHFKNAKGATYKIVPTPDPGDKDPLVTYFLPVLQTYFETEVSEIDYALTSVNNTPPTGGVVLTPKSFVFASGGTDADGFLSLYIQTVGSGNPPGNPNPSFQPGDSQIQPIPGQYSASLIFSYDLITKYFLKSQLEKKGYKVEFYIDPATTSGISMKLTTNTTVVLPGDDGRYIFGGYSYDGLNIPIDQNNPIKFAIRNSSIYLNWASGEKKSEWSEYNMGGNSWGAQYVNISLNKGPIAFTGITDQAINLSSLTFKSSDFTVEHHHMGCDFLERLNHCSEFDPPYYDKLTLRVPDINLVLDGINFFATTNLLSPGQQVIDFDATAGIKTPFDFMLVGYVKGTH